MKKIDKNYLNELNLGKRACKNLMESLAVDFEVLLQERLQVTDNDRLMKISQGKITSKMLESARLLLEEKGFEVFEVLKNEISDTLRGIACYVLALEENLKFSQKLELMRPLAGSDHFGVREWAWIALRPLILKNLKEAMQILNGWVEHEEENIRRFAIESVRPRGVWCSHCEELKKSPEMALDLLEKVKMDPSLYVQKSVGNWLNDAAKSHPLWVKSLCLRWNKECNHPSTLYICKRARRSL